MEDARKLIEDAMRRRREAVRVSHAGLMLDPAKSFWVMRRDAWFRLIQVVDFVRQSVVDPHERKLLGLPVRLTVDDEADTPDLQLVMEPAAQRVAPGPLPPWPESDVSNRLV